MVEWILLDLTTRSFLFCLNVLMQQIFKIIVDHFKVPVGIDFEYIARFLISNDKKIVLNAVSSAVVWCLWKYRNSMIFDNTEWIFVFFSCPNGSLLFRC